MAGVRQEPGHGSHLRRSALRDAPSPACPTHHLPRHPDALSARGDVAEWLDARGLVWKYEGPAYGSEDGQYLPDFQISGLLIEGVPHALYFDVKPPGKSANSPG